MPLAIDAANFGTWFIQSVTREFITDARLKELFGYYPDEELSIEQALAQITEEYRGFVTTKLEDAIYHNGDYDVTYPVIGLHDIKLRWLRAIGNLKADPSGAFSAFTGVVMDITEQYLAAQKIEESEKHFRYLADLVPAKISNALPNGELTFFNKQWLDYAGMSFEDLRDFGYHQMMHPDETPGFQAQLAEAAAKGMALESEIRFKDMDGNYRWHLNIASPVFNDQGEIGCSVQKFAGNQLGFQLCNESSDFSLTTFIVGGRDVGVAFFTSCQVSFRTVGTGNDSPGMSAIFGSGTGCHVAGSTNISINYFAFSY